MCAGPEALLARLEAGIACGGAVEELLALLARLLELDAVAIAAEGRSSLRVRESRAGQAARWWSALASSAAAELACRPLGSWYVWNRPANAPRGSPRSAAIVELGAPARDRVTVALLRGLRSFSRDEVLLLRWLAPSLERALSGEAARRALGALSNETIEDVTARCLASATISLRARTIEWSPSARELFDRRMGAPLASIAPMILRAAAGGGERVLPGGLRVAFVFRGATRAEAVALLFDGASPPSTSPRALNLAEELLSPRQRQVARRIAAGNSLPAVAAALGIRHETARAHLSAAYDRLGVRDRARLALTLAEAALR